MTNRLYLKVFILFAFFVFSKQISFAQYDDGFRRPIELGIDIGPCYLLGDLGGSLGKGTYFLKDLNKELGQVSKGLSLTVFPFNWGGLRVGMHQTKFLGNDAIIKSSGSDEVFRKRRNLDFRTNIWEAYGAVEVYPISIFKPNNSRLIDPYFFVGVGIFNFDPEGSVTDINGQKTWYKLQPLRTEGQGMSEYPDRKPYKLTQINLPFGGGFKINLSNRLYAGTEIIYRHTFTDYIDDVSTNYIDPQYFYKYLSAEQAAIAARIHDKSIDLTTGIPFTNAPGEQRGNSNKNDDYFSVMFRIGYKFSSQSNYQSGGRRSKRSQTSCPIVF